MYRVSDYSNQFNIHKFLDDHRRFAVVKKKLVAKLETISYLPSKTDDTGIRGSNKSELTASLAMRRMVIEEEIAEIDKLIELYDTCFNKLTEREQDVIALFFSAERSTPIKRQAYCRKYLTNETDLYSRDKPDAIDHFRRLIEEQF